MFVVESITGVAVVPIDGARSAQPTSAGFQGVPRYLVHRWAPLLAGSNP